MCVQVGGFVRAEDLRTGEDLGSPRLSAGFEKAKQGLLDNQGHSPSPKGAQNPSAGVSLGIT